MARNVTYKGHQIKAHAVLVTESEDGEWAAHAVIRVPLPGGGREQPLGDPDNRTVPTPEDAEGDAVTSRCDGSTVTAHEGTGPGFFNG